MASEIRTYQVVIPAGTPISAPFVQAITFPQRVVTQVDWQVPSGPSGLMGWALTIGGQPVIPRNPGAFIVADNLARSWPLTGYPNQGQWQVTGYNLDIYPHSVFLDFLLELIDAQPATPAEIPNAQLSSAPAAPSLLAVPGLDLTGVLA